MRWPAASDCGLMYVQGCSAVTGEKLVDGIDWLVSDISSRIFLSD